MAAHLFSLFPHVRLLLLRLFRCGRRILRTHLDESGEDVRLIANALSTVLGVLD